MGTHGMGFGLAEVLVAIIVQTCYEFQRSVQLRFGHPVVHGANGSKLVSLESDSGQ